MFTTFQSRVGEDIEGARGRLKTWLNWPMIKCTVAINMGWWQSNIPKGILGKVSIETTELFCLIMMELAI